MAIVITMVAKKNTVAMVETSEFEANCVLLIDQVAETGTPLVITRNGTPVAQLGPVVSRTRTLTGAHRGMIDVVGDIVAPIDEEWETAG